jgi:protocatechuate 3,4-dioxygenase alpha subunit
MLQTPSQTVGPFFAYSLTAKQYGYNYNSIITDSLVDETIEGERIYITGKIFDGQGKVIPDAIIELIQRYEVVGMRYEVENPEPKTSYLRPHTSKIARLGTGTTPDNSFTFTTIKPKAINGQAPFISVIIMMRGSLHHLYTRLYFADEVAANQQDALLNIVPIERRNTLIAKKIEKNNQVFYEFNIKMQGEEETAFFQV